MEKIVGEQMEMFGADLWDDTLIVGLDLETTGFRKTDKIVEIAFVLLEGDKIIDKYHTLVNPEMGIPNDSTAVHGLSDVDVADAPVFEEILPEVVFWLSRGAPWIAHNLPFDARMLRQQMPRKSWPNGVPTLCTQQMAGKRGIKKKKLMDVAARFGIEQRDAHTALDDARCCALLARRMTSGLRVDEHYTKMSEEWWT